MEQRFKQIPLICTPLTGRTKKEVLDQLDVIVPKQPDLIEWRADFFQDLAKASTVLEVVDTIKEKTDIPLLFTIRSVHEGGEEISLSEQEKVQLLQHICAKSNVDYIDFEVNNEQNDVLSLRDAAKQHGKKLILSYHNFAETPEEKTLFGIAEKMNHFAADIMKLAVMPNDKNDVFRLLEVTRKLNKQYNKPLITMAMGELGVLSRIIGWVYGSCVTFAVGVSASAPGQIELETLRNLIDMMKNVMPDW